MGARQHAPTEAKGNRKKTTMKKKKDTISLSPLSLSVYCARTHLLAPVQLEPSTMMPSSSSAASEWL